MATPVGSQSVVASIHPGGDGLLRFGLGQPVPASVELDLQHGRLKKRSHPMGISSPHDAWPSGDLLRHRRGRSQRPWRHTSRPFRC
jgi:hypothetical protein